MGEQITLLQKIVLSSPLLSPIIASAPRLGLDDYYIGAGCVTQTVWNYLFSNPPCYGIKDVDFAYFDPTRLDYADEDEVVQQAHLLWSEHGVKLDVKNQARVHLWYRKHHGYDIEPYPSLEAAINTWPTTATAIGVRLDQYGRFAVYAPFGLHDLFHTIVRPNKGKRKTAHT